MRYISKLITASLLAVPALTLAQQTSITFDGIGKGNDYKLTYNGQTEDVFVGSLNFSQSGSKDQFSSFCVDLDHWITNGQSYTVDALNTTSLSSDDRYRLAGNILDAGYKTATDANHSAALQMAIWSAVYGDSFKLSGVSDSVKQLEQGYFNAGKSFDGSAVYLKENSNCGQSQITTTPEPASMAVLGIGAFGVFFRRRKS